MVEREFDEQNFPERLAQELSHIAQDIWRKVQDGKGQPAGNPERDGAGHAPEKPIIPAMLSFDCGVPSGKIFDSAYAAANASDRQLWYGPKIVSTFGVGIAAMFGVKIPDNEMLQNVQAASKSPDCSGGYVYVKLKSQMDRSIDRPIAAGLVQIDGVHFGNERNALGANVECVDQNTVKYTNTEGLRINMHVLRMPVSVDIKAMTFKRNQDNAGLLDGNVEATVTISNPLLQVPGAKQADLPATLDVRAKVDSEGKAAIDLKDLLDQLRRDNPALKESESVARQILDEHPLVREGVRKVGGAIIRHLAGQPSDKTDN